MATRAQIPGMHLINYIDGWSDEQNGKICKEKHIQIEITFKLRKFNRKEEDPENWKH